jgi:uncharacterized protein YerC
VRVILSYATEFDHHEGHQIARALLALGHDVDVVNSAVDDATRYWPGTRTFAPDAELNDVLRVHGAEETDLLLYIEPRGLLPRGIERARCRTACILCDTMLSLEPRVDLSRLFDDVVLLHPHALDLIRSDRSRVHWMPYAVDPTLFHDRGVARDLDVAFVGATESIWRVRKPLLKRIAARYRTNDFFADRCPFEEIAAIYNRARIVIHVPIVDALNPRIFEAMGCGALLLTGRVNNRIEELLEDGEHFVTYDDEDDASEKIDYFLRHEDARARIARAGCERVHRDHTYVERLRGLLERIGALPRQAAPARRMTAGAVEDIYQRRHKQAGQVDALVRRALAAPVFSVARYRTLAHAARTLLARVQNRMRAPN